jgi:hypothetical protein
MRALFCLLWLLMSGALPASTISVDVYANTTTVAPEQSFSYTLDARGDDPLGRTTSVFLDVAPGLTIWRVSGNGDGCVTTGQRAQCVGTVGIGRGLLMFVSVRANDTPRCADYTSTALADDHATTAAGALTLPRAEGACTVMLPLLEAGSP